MTEARRTHLRRVMTLAWGLYRDPTECRTFAVALRGAWRFLSRLAEKPLLLGKRLARGGHVHLADTLRSPTLRRHGSAAYVGGRASVAYLTARVGS